MNMNGDKGGINDVDTDSILEAFLPILLQHSESIRALLQKPAFQRLLSSSLMRDAVEAMEIPLWTEIYNEMYAETVTTTTQSMAYGILNILYYGLPILLLILFLGRYNFGMEHFCTC